MLAKIKLLLGLSSTDKDAILNALIASAIEEAINYTHNDSVAEYEGAICNMVIYMFNRLGTEGVNAESYSGVSFTYSSDYPESILRQLKAHRKVMTISD